MIKKFLTLQGTRRFSVGSARGKLRLANPDHALPF
jgi:hypothetical protein